MEEMGQDALKEDGKRVKAKGKVKMEEGGKGREGVEVKEETKV